VNGRIVARAATLAESGCNATAMTELVTYADARMLAGRWATALRTSIGAPANSALITATLNTRDRWSLCAG